METISGQPTCQMQTFPYLSGNVASYGFPGAEDSLERIWNFKPKKDDIWIVTYPKCGTTLTQELMVQIANQVDIENEVSKKNILLKYHS